jgi:Pentapeptide repeats (8 copies)
MVSDKHLAMLRDGVPAWNAWRRREPLTRPELEGLALTLAQKQWGETSGGPIDLSQAVLRDADLRHATLIGADLSGASLCGANLTGARMQGADLRNADLSRTCFDEADLSGAVLDGANLQSADLSRARNLTAAQLVNAGGDARTLLPPSLPLPAGWLNGATARASSPAAAPRAVHVREQSVLKGPVPARHEVAEQAAPRPSVLSQATAGVRSKAAAVTSGANSGAGAVVQAVRGAGARSSAKAGAAASAVGALGTASATGASNALKSVRQFGSNRVKNAGDVLSSVKTFGSDCVSGLRHLVSGGLAAVKDTAATAPGAAPVRRLPQLLAIALGAIVVLFGVERAVSWWTTDSGPVPTIAVSWPGSEAARKQAAERDATAAPAKKKKEKARVAATAAKDTAAASRGPAKSAVGSEPLEDTPPAASEIVEELMLAPSEQVTSVEEVLRNDEQRVSAVDSGIEVAARIDEPSAGPLPVGDGAKAFLESYVGDTAQPQSVEETMPRTDLPLPEAPQAARSGAPVEERVTELAPAEAAEPEPPQRKSVAPAAVSDEATTELARATLPDPEPIPRTLEGYLSLPDKTSDWIKVFIKDFYLSGEELDETDLRRIYSETVEYFGKRKVSLKKVSDEKASYYRDWPERRYALIPGSIAIKWKSDTIADITFLYDFKVASPKKGTHKGRGRARLRMDLGRTSGVIVREDGEVIRSN